MELSEIIALSGKNSKAVSGLLINALNKAGVPTEGISVVWGMLSEMELPDNINTAMLLLSDFGEYDLSDKIKNINKLIVPSALKPLLDLSGFENLEVYTYAVESNYADFIAKNIVNRDNISHFELLGPDNIGRIHFDGKKYSNAQDVLAVASMMLALGVEFRKVIEVFSRDK